MSTHAHFDGKTIEPQDIPRLASQQERVMELMKSGRWFTLSQIARATGASEASASARCRDMRKARWGGWIVDRRRVEGGLFEYRARQPEPSEVQPCLF